MKAADPTAGLWGYAELAEATGLAASTLRHYRNKGLLPEPDLVLLGRPFWKPATARRWMANRPGRGNWGRKDRPA